MREVYCKLNAHVGRPCGFRLSGFSSNQSVQVMLTIAGAALHLVLRAKRARHGRAPREMRRLTVASVLVVAAVGERRPTLGVRAAHDAVPDTLDEPPRRRRAGVQRRGLESQKFHDSAHVLASLRDLLDPHLCQQHTHTVIDLVQCERWKGRAGYRRGHSRGEQRVLRDQSGRVEPDLPERIFLSSSAQRSPDRKNVRADYPFRDQALPADIFVGEIRDAVAVVPVAARRVLCDPVAVGDLGRPCGPNRRLAFSPTASRPVASVSPCRGLSDGEVALEDSLRRMEAGPVILATIVVEDQSKCSELEAAELRAVRPCITAGSIDVRGTQPSDRRSVALTTTRMCSDVAGKSFGAPGGFGPKPGLK